MKRIILITFALLMVLQSHVYSQHDPVIDKIIEIGKSDNQTMQHLDVLCNRIGGRLIGSDAYETAVKWATKKLEEWGMEVIVDSVGSLPVGFNRGPWFGRMLDQNGMNLHFATPSYTVGTKGVQIGHVMLEPKTRAQFDRMKGKLNGAWVLISGKSNGWPIDISDEANTSRISIMLENEEIEKKNNVIRQENWANRNTSNPQKELLPLKEEPALFYKEMVDAGILGIIQSAPNPIVALYDRKNLEDLTFENLPKVPDIKLDEHQFAVIEQMAIERQRFFLEFDIRNHFRLGPIPYHSVIGVIPGTEFPDEYVIMGGHLDAFDVATGGVDNGSGATPAMEAARLIMQAGGKPKRTILVCLWAGEEFGLLGSKSWVEKNADKLDKISNMFNRDGGPTVASSIKVPAAMMKDMKQICEPINQINPYFPFTVSEMQPVKRPTEPWGTDSGPFAVAGVPTLSFGTSDPKGYDFTYREIWHTERDLYNMSIPEYQEHTSIVTAIVVYGIANLDHLLSRKGYWKKDEPKTKEKERKR
ncbi:MAG: M28 family peptidase [Bacteroidales bacterium]|nr:M28 family peptidase [Bacteroidales bacterium]